MVIIKKYVACNTQFTFPGKQRSIALKSCVERPNHCLWLVKYHCDEIKFIL